MKYIESPTTYQYQFQYSSLYLAGGITGCPDWQQEIVHLLAKTNLVLLNPRRKQFPIDDPTTAESQIRWEYNHLRVADEILFWFPYETLCPIALYELGAWSMTDVPMYVGVHPDYQRRLDIELQTKLTRPDIKIVYSLYELAKQVTETPDR
jgi:hypothetical protein